MSDPTVYIIDDDAAVRDSMSWLVESVGLKVRTFSSAKDFFEIFDPSLSGCLVLDVRMPGLSGLDLQRELISHGCSLPILIITGYGEVQGAVRALKAGAIDYLEKPVSDQMLLDRIHQCLEKHARFRQMQTDKVKVEARIASLTPRQREVMELVLAGNSNKEIAMQMNISIKTVESHRSNVMQKMEASSIANLARISLGVAKR
ncbi:MAG: response regulator transcription factor [Sphingomonadales bacterium]